MLSITPSTVNRIMPVLMSLGMLRITCQTKARKPKPTIAIFSIYKDIEKREIKTVLLESGSL